MSEPRPAPGIEILPWLAMAAFAAGCGMRMLDPLLPMVGAEFGVSIGAVSVIIATFSIAYGAGQIVVGPVGDRHGKLRVVCAAVVLYGLLTIATVLAGSLTMMAAIRALTGLAAGAIIPVALAWIGDTVPYANRQAVLGRFLTGMVMAQLLAGPAAGIVGEYVGWRAAFLLLGLLSFACVVPLALRIGPALWQRPEGPAPRGMGLSGFQNILRRRAGQRLLLAATLDGFLLFGGAFPFIGAFLIEEFSLSAAQAGLGVAGFGVGAFAYTRLAPLLVRRLGERRLVTAGGLLLAAMLLGFAVAWHWAVVVACQVVAGLAFFMFHGVLQARATEALPEARATAVSAFAMALFFGQSLGSLVFGAVIGRAGYAAGFILAAVLVAALAGWIRVRLLTSAVMKNAP
ncbi:MAG: MFS transporter [Pseudomonadota bacterium]